MRQRLLVMLALALGISVAGGGIAWALTAPTHIVYFEYEDFSLSPEQKEELDALVDDLEDATIVRVDGYVQRSREEDKDKGPARLSEKRAQAVTNYLQSMIKERSPNKQDIEWQSVGRGQPALDVGLPWARRVEIFLEP